MEPFPKGLTDAPSMVAVCLFPSMTMKGASNGHLNSTRPSSTVMGSTVIGDVMFWFEKS